MKTKLFTLIILLASISVYSQNGVLIEYYQSDGRPLVSPEYQENVKFEWTLIDNGKTLRMRGYDLSKNSEVFHELDRKVLKFETTSRGKEYTLSDNRGGTVVLVFSLTHKQKVTSYFESGSYHIHSGNIDYSSIIE